MGVWLFVTPKNEDNAVLERIAGAAPGTAAKLEAAEAALRSATAGVDLRDTDAAYDIYNDAVEAVGVGAGYLEGLLFGQGLGRLQARVDSMGLDRHCGDTSDPAQMRAILEAQLEKWGHHGTWILASAQEVDETISMHAAMVQRAIDALNVGELDSLTWG